jgi:hypothetical protein
MKTNLFFLAFGLLTIPVAQAQFSPNPTANRDIRLVKEFLTSQAENQAGYAYTAPGAVGGATEPLAALGNRLPAPAGQPGGFTNKQYRFEAAESVIAGGSTPGVWVGLRGTWTATDAQGHRVRVPFRHLARLEAGRIVELHTARGEDGDRGGWWRRPLFGTGDVCLAGKP